MARIPRQWLYCPRPASCVPEAVKEQVTAKADEIIETLFKPRYVKPPPKKARFNYIVESTRSGIRIACSSAPGSPVQVPEHCRRFSKIALLDLHTWLTGVSIWRTCGTPASGAKSSATCRWKKRLTPSGMSRFSTLQVEKFWCAEHTLQS